jgi:UDP-N-acetylmuramate--alanine ligase
MAIFQPHLYARTRDFAPEFAEVLSLCDKVIMIPIYPARELPIEGVTSELIGRSITASWELVDRFDVANYLKDVDTDVVVTFGAGNIDVICNDVAEVLKAKVNNN